MQIKKSWRIWGLSFPESTVLGKNKFGLLFIVEENEELSHLLQDTFIQSETYIAVVPVCANKKESSV